MRESKNRKTVGITLRLDKNVLHEYSRIALRANLIEIQKGRLGRYTAQDVMRHRLSTLPSLRKAIQAGTTKKTQKNEEHRMAHPPIDLLHGRIGEL